MVLEKLSSTALDKLKQAEEETKDKSKSLADSKQQIIELAEEIRKTETGNEKLKIAYNQLLQKYANLKSNMK